MSDREARIEILTEPFAIPPDEKRVPISAEDLKRISNLTERGGEGSGHHGHAGRPGEVGGSVPSGVAGGRMQELRDRAEAAGLDVGIGLEEMLDVQSRAVIRDHGPHEEETGGRAGFDERWSEAYENLEPLNPEFAEYVMEGVIQAREQGMIPEGTGLIVRGLDPDRPSEEWAMARWHGYILVIQSRFSEGEEGLIWTKQYFQDRQKSIADIGGEKKIDGVANLFDHYFTGIAAHEYGHAVEDRLLNANIKAGTQSPTQRAQNMIGTEPERVEKWISVYASGKAHELVAEAYALTQHPQFEEMPEETQAIVREIFGEDMP